MEIKYEKPVYDPFVTFNPSASFLGEVIKQLKQQAYEILQYIQALKAESLWSEKIHWQQEVTAKHRRICRRIEHYTYRLGQKEFTGSWEYKAPVGQITDEDKDRARDVPIESLYSGDLRRYSGKLAGLCPFHSERTPSFHIFVASNRWHCFGCGADGDSIDFVARRDNLKYFDAIKLLINK